MMVRNLSAVRSIWSAHSLRKLGLVVLLSAAGTMVLPAWAGPGQRMHSGAEGGIWGANPERIERLLGRVNASEAQRGQIKQVLQTAANDLSAQRETGRALRQQAMAVLMAPTVDAQAAEQVRQQMLVHHDQSSQRMMAAMLEVSRVLTAEQRAQLAAHMQQHGRGHPSQRDAPVPPKS